nr:MAG TPA: hypothetical protein [Caudoviricetes sp.]
MLRNYSTVSLTRCEGVILSFRRLGAMQSTPQG